MTQSGMFPPFVEQDKVNCHHNYTELENHYGRNVWVTRKGAIRARKGDRGIIPGSMGTNSYIVSGLENREAFHSAPHGAGRKMSRGAARRNIDVATFDAAMEGKVWLNKRATALLDEHPDAYKDITTVLEDSKDLVTVQHHLKAVLNYKGI